MVLRHEHAFQIAHALKKAQVDKKGYENYLMLQFNWALNLLEEELVVEENPHIIQDLLVGFKGTFTYGKEPVVDEILIEIAHTARKLVNPRLRSPRHANNMHILMDALSLHTTQKKYAYLSRALYSLSALCAVSMLLSPIGLLGVIGFFAAGKLSADKYFQKSESTKNIQQAVNILYKGL